MIKKLVILLVLLAINCLTSTAAAELKLSCPLGSALSYDKTRCLECSPGYYSNIPNRSCTSSSNSASACCTPCPRGHQCPLPGTVTPTICPAGTASSYDQTTCLNCPVGFFSAEGAQCTSSTNSGTSCCKYCPYGHVCPLPGTTTPQMCPAGTASNYYYTECLKCPVSYFNSYPGAQCTASSNSASSCCQLCPYGHICPLPGTITPEICPAGSASSYYYTECLKCPAGYFTNYQGAQCMSSSNTGSSCCKFCPTGHVCTNTGTTRPTMCPAGSTANYLRTECLSCPVGYYSYAAAQCTASNNLNSYCCPSCPSGHVCSQTGTTTPVQCQASTAASYDQSVCLKCSVGYYSFDSAQCTSSSNTAAVCCK